MPIIHNTFKKFQTLVREESGIHLSDAKKNLLTSRLAKRLRHYGIDSYDEYYRLVNEDSFELQMMIDIITTNETSFFREPHHFDYLKNSLLPEFKGSKYRVWSAAASIGAEAYTLAMILDEGLVPRNISWEVVGTDINTEVIEKAKQSLFPMEHATKIDKKYLKNYCLKGTNKYEGFFLIDDTLRRNCTFLHANLMYPPSSQIGQFDVIFLRNMLIYFDNENKKIIVENVIKALKKGGYLFIGHSETLNKITNQVRQIRPTVYIKD
ncbi:methyltransferase domain-containing protein [bacterium]|nr:methyltransferase domain-containing protein [bacterium]MBU1882875.1 methyltransferase domain-containing protein [bacterium]